MDPFNIPPEGLVLRREPKHNTHSKQTKEPTQVIRLDLVESVTKDILRSLKNNEQVRLRCGKRPVVQFGKKTVTLESSIDPFPTEIYSKSDDDTAPLYFSGKSSHRLEVKKAEKDTAKADEALATLESTLKSIQEERASNETSLKEDQKQGLRKDVKPSPLLGQGSALRKDHLLGPLSRSTPGSPFLSASYSPRQGPTSAPLSSGMSTKDRIRLDAIRVPLVHLLAVRPMTPKAICDQLRATKDDIDKLLDKVSWESKVEDGKRELKEKSYRELDVWKFQYRSQEDRQAAIDHAIQAYDRMRVEKKDPLWQLLLPVEERGKGKILSKLNFDKPVSSHATPKPERPNEEGNESKNEASDRDHGKARAKKDREVGGVEKARKDKASAKGAVKGDPSGAVKVKDKDSSHSKPAKTDTKFKSSERIEDSDEEAEAADVVAKPKKPVSGTTKSTSTVKRKAEHDPLKSAKSPLTTSSPKKNAHKSTLSSSSTSSGSNSASDKPRSAVTGSSKSLKPQNHQRLESSASRISPRPRHDSSPQKPSPLGSSPPTTSTDLDNSSSSKASNHSSAPSSPPSSTDMPQTKQGNKYSPVISDKSRNVSRGRSPGPNPVKRKAAPTEDERSAKRQHQDQTSTPNHSTPLSNGVTDHPALKRPAGPIRTDSERSSSPEKPGPNRDDVIEEARRFQKYYKRYKDLYDKISQMDAKERDEKDMGDLWKMHKRLKEMKAEIWANWGKVEKVDAADPNEAVRAMLAVA
ncbi:uncharacterized protein Z520_02360 [Fonsecaea multimorphosa CBS 102226]|uniref:Uncharacterized protein n=1 Tax=Fonsecaea multimorphosa CBS 102226 TaxID=1442371 RepID=A0A0D2IYT9_9EURO|nr:uncharacterized protein Z520_02360 [Fonsecaea multimorphosa CBS 102226]KIY02222.1 hypothetical protein Z520_02360 [Fonsecaea multimorphosa CBS 102226]OAL29413.1 hypothetical protein AYO22_02307 [Fonsecaea multimorphosa]